MSELPPSQAGGAESPPLSFYDTQDLFTPEPIEPESSLLDPPGVTSHEDFNALEYKRWLIGLQLSAKLESVGQDTLAGKLRNCHQDKSWRVCCGCSKRTHYWNRCDIFWCPQCSPRLARKRVDDLMWWVSKMRAPKHVVLTLRNIPNLTQSFLRESQKALSRLRRRKNLAGWTSGFWAMEITNRGRGWHVHFHLVVDAPWTDVRELSRIWKECNGGAGEVVWIEDATKGGLKASLPRYVTKYTAKGFGLHEWDADMLAQFVTAIARVRTFGVFGALCGERTAHREWLREIRGKRKPCECGCVSFKFYSDQELQWSDQFTGFNRRGQSHSPPDLQLRWRIGLGERAVCAAVRAGLCDERCVEDSAIAPFVQA